MTKYADLKFKKDRIAHIKRMVGTNRAWALRALIRIYEYQTADEQAIGYTQNLNGVGFNGADSDILSSMAEQVNNGRQMTDRQMEIIFKKMPKYAKQLMEIADEAAAAG